MSSLVVFRKLRNLYLSVSILVEKVKRRLADNVAVFYIQTVVIELRRLRKMDVEAARRIINLAWNRRKELLFILGIKNVCRPIAGIEKSFARRLGREG